MVLGGLLSAPLLIVPMWVALLPTEAQSQQGACLLLHGRFSHQLPLSTLTSSGSLVIASLTALSLFFSSKYPTQCCQSDF